MNESADLSKESKPPAAKESKSPEARSVLVAETGEGNYANRVEVNGHTLRADEPREAGGGDTGPSPYDFLLAALGACTSMTLRMYAERRGWPLEGVRVRLRHAKIHASDCEQCETEDGRIDQIKREITLEGPLEADQRKRLLEIAEKCPVHRTLHSEVEILTQEAGAVR